MAPLVGVTLGDPAGIGPELVARACAMPPAGGRLRVYGDPGVLAAAAARLGLAASTGAEQIELVELTELGDVVPGRPSEAGARAQLAYLERAIVDARAGAIQALCTAPIHKAACKAVGFDFPGHTELLAARLSSDARPLPVTMMLAGPRLRVALATTHLALGAVPAALAADGGRAIERAIVQAAEGLARIYGITGPRVAVAGLNPHAGEQGHFGDEEQRVITPAIARARLRLGERATVSGPHVPDAVFRDAVAGAHDVVVALYHDQGLIPVKLVDFEEAVNVTLGLPIVRTSPDHGVAYDIAGTGRARSTSFDAALQLACDAARR